MPAKTQAILLILLVTVHSIVGGLGGVTICLGGGHEHHPSEQASACELACAHESGVGMPAPVEEHDDGCDCTDLELTSEAFQARLVGAAGLDLAPQPLLTAIASTIVHNVDFACGVVRPDQSADPSGGSRLLIVRTTRLLI